MIRSSLLVLAAITAVGAPLSALAECFGPVGRTDTLWLVAIKLRPDPSVSPQRMMLALLEENPQAFTADNVNALSAGSVLCSENTDTFEFDDREAVEEIRRHNREWQTGRVAGSVDVAPAETTPEPRTESGVSRTVVPAPASAPAPASQTATATVVEPQSEVVEGTSDTGQQQDEALDLDAMTAAFESRLARMEDRIEELESRRTDLQAPRVSELTSKVQRLETTLLGALLRLDRSEREVTRLRALVSTSAVEDALASLESRLSELDAAMEQMRSAAPALSDEIGAVSQDVSRLGEDFALLGLRSAHNEEQIRAVVTLLEAESEAIEEFKSKLRRSLHLISSVAPPGKAIRGFEPPRALSKDRPAVPAAPPAASGVRGTPGPTIALQDAEAAMEPMPTPAPGGTQAAVEPMPTPAPQSGEQTAESAPDPDTVAAPAATEAEPEIADYITIVTDRVSNWLSRIRDLW